MPPAEPISYIASHAGDNFPLLLLPPSSCYTDIKMTVIMYLVISDTNSILELDLISLLLIVSPQSSL